MDNDLMARRLRPPSQPTPQSGQSDQPGQPPSPWDVPLADDGSFAPSEPQPPQNDPPFAPPDPLARADVPWDRPAPEAWPPTEESGTDDPQRWSAQGGAPAADDARPEGPSGDALGESYDLADHRRMQRQDANGEKRDDADYRARAARAGSERQE